MDAIETLK
jgi:Alpha-kinase family